MSYLALDRVFTGNMTGNVVFVAFGLVGAGHVSLINNVAALLAFVAGSLIGGRIVGHGHPQGLPRSSRWVLAGGAVVVFGTAVFWFVVGSPTRPELAVFTALLAIVMGAQVSAVKPVGNSDVTTIVVTNTLANLARDSRLAGGNGANWWQRLAAVVAMAGGAAIGAVIVTSAAGPWALLAAVVLFVAGSLALVHASRR